MQIVDLYPDFRRFWELARYRPFPSQAQLWREIYARPHQEFLEPYLNVWADPGMHLEGALLRYPKTLPLMDRLAQRVPALIEELAPGAADYCDSCDGLDVVLLAGLYTRASVTIRRENRLTLLIFLESFDGIDHVKALLARVLVRAFFLGREPGCHDKPYESLSFARNLATSGVEAIGAGQLVPGLSLSEYVTLSSHPQGFEWWQWCLSHEPLLAARACMVVDETGRGVFEQFFGSAAVLGRSRTGRYLGWRVLSELGGASPKNAIGIASSPDWPQGCAEVLERLAKPRIRTTPVSVGLYG